MSVFATIARTNKSRTELITGFCLTFHQLHQQFLLFRVLYGCHFQLDNSVRIFYKPLQIDEKSDRPALNSSLNQLISMAFTLFSGIHVIRPTMESPLSWQCKQPAVISFKTISLKFCFVFAS